MVIYLYIDFIKQFNVGLVRDIIFSSRKAELSFRFKLELYILSIRQLNSEVKFVTSLRPLHNWVAATSNTSINFIFIKHNNLFSTSKIFILALNYDQISTFYILVLTSMVEIK